MRRGVTQRGWSPAQPQGSDCEEPQRSTVQERRETGGPGSRPEVEDQETKSRSPWAQAWLEAGQRERGRVRIGPGDQRCREAGRRAKS